jgi:WD40 repeat protein
MDIYFSPTGPLGCVSVHSNDGLRIFDSTTGAVEHTYYCSELSQSPFSPDGSRFATVSYQDGGLNVWDATTFSRIKFIAVPDSDYVTQIVFSPDGDRLAVWGQGGVRVYVIASGAVVATMSPPRYFNDVAWSRDASKLLAGEVIWDPSTGSTILALQGPGYFSPDGRYFLTAGSSGTVSLLDQTTLSSIYTFTGIGQLNAAAFSPSGDRVVIGNAQGLCQVFLLSPSPLAITQQPASLTVNAGQPATFAVAATGTGPLSYQWSKAGWTISGATQATYSASDVQASDQGGYTCTISNSSGSVNSNAATLTVLGQILGPHNWVGRGERVELEFDAPGMGPGWHYEWFKNGSALAGQTDWTLVIPSATPSDTGTYKCVATDESDGVYAPKFYLFAAASSVPAAGAIGLGLLAALLAFHGVVRSRRSRDEEK